MDQATRDKIQAELTAARDRQAAAAAANATACRRPEVRIAGAAMRPW